MTVVVYVHACAVCQQVGSLVELFVLECQVQRRLTDDVLCVQVDTVVNEVLQYRVIIATDRLLLANTTACAAVVAVVAVTLFNTTVFVQTS